MPPRLPPFARLLPLGLLLAVACFEPPVTETIEIRFLAPEGIGLTVSVSIADSAGKDGNRALEERMDETRRSLLEGRDDWSRRIARLEPALERGSWEKHEGLLARWVRSAAFEDPRGLSDFFADTAIHPRVSEGEGWQELALGTSRPQRATREQQRVVDERLERWCETLAAYYLASAELHAHLAKNPDRARACYGHILESSLSEEEKAALPEPSEAESAILQPLEEAMGTALEVLDVAAEEAYSLDELSRIVFDPFPGTVVVRLPGPVLEAEGFAMGADGRLVAPPTSLWTALRSLDGRFVAPDPMLAMVAHSRDRERGPFDLDRLLARPRHAAAPPSAIDVGRAIRDALAPAPVYRVRWSTAGLEGKDDVEEWLSGRRADG